MISGDNRLSFPSNKLPAFSSPIKVLNPNLIVEYFQSVFADANITQVSSTEWQKNLTALIEKHLPEGVRDHRDLRLLDESLPNRYSHSGQQRTEIPYISELTYHVTKGSHEVVEFSIHNNGYPFVTLQVVPDIDNMSRVPHDTLDWASAHIVTDMKEVIWSPAHCHVISTRLPFKEYFNDVFTSAGLERIWFSVIPETGYFAITNDVVVLDESLTSFQVENFYVKSSWAGKLRICHHPNLSQESFNAFVDSTEARQKVEDYWTHIFRSKHMTPELLVEACATVNGRYALDVMLYSIYATDELLLPAILEMEDGSNPSFLYGDALGMIKKNDHVSASVWYHFRKEETSSEIAKDLKSRTLSYVIDIFNFLRDKKIKPEWLKEVIEAIAAYPQGPIVLANFLAKDGYVESHLIDSLPDEWVKTYALEVL